eukprot:TRINITY_DN21519_c0_g1_i1.p1 TRINITY_DN21519_c0_g1~~TRINITY_DN21519_c0_g1_i1.p1  ORF type:complete len:398 (-),score=53.81 TRINITY_DN21519_c0_g1_i1:50-1108(-)
MNKLALSGEGMLPLLFALIREACAAPVLFAFLWLARTQLTVEEGLANEELCATDADGDSPRRRAALRMLAGAFIFVDQFCSLTGVTLADPLSAAAWQPSQVVFTAAICAMVGMERLTAWKTVGMLLTICGALCLVFLDGRTTGDAKAGTNKQLGHLFLFFNCMAGSMEVIIWRKLLKNAESPLEHIRVMAESYLVAACLMAISCVATSCSRTATDFFCPKCNGNAWHVPPKALMGVLYSVLFQTLIGYLAQAWALRYAESTLAALYATAQPIVAAALTCLLLWSGMDTGGVLQWPVSGELLGAILIIAGLVVAERGRSDAAASIAGGRSRATEAGCAQDRGGRVHTLNVEGA